MKLVKAYIRHRKTEDVYNALYNAGYCCMTFVECEGTGRYSDSSEKHISDKYPFTDAYRVIKIEILVSSIDVNEVVRIIKENGRTGYKGDGLIIVSPVDNVYKIRNDIEGNDAI